MPAWTAEPAQRDSVNVSYSYASQASNSVSSVLDEIIAMATSGIAALTGIKNEATACKAATASPHTDGTDHGASGSAKRTQAVQSIERAYLRIQEGLVVARLTSTGVPLGCKQELEHPGGGDDHSKPARPA